MSRDATACAGGCGGRGTCSTDTNSCLCDDNWYLSDCSGGLSDLNTITSLTKNLVTVMSTLSTSPNITNNTFLLSVVSSIQGDFYPSSYFYNTIGKISNSNGIIISVLNFVES